MGINDKTKNQLIEELGELHKKIVELEKEKTERKVAEDKLKHSELRLKNAQQIGHLGDWDWNIVTGELSWSDETFRIYGFYPQEFIPTFEKFESILHPDDREDVLQTVDKALKSTGDYSIDFRFIYPDGKVGWIHSEGVVSRNDRGEPVRFFGTQVDITTRKKAENKLRMSTRELRESNIALKVLLKQRENDKSELEENVLSNIKTIIMPYIEKLKKQVNVRGTCLFKYP